MAALAQAVGAASQGLGPLGMAIADAKRDPVFHDGSSYAVRNATRVRATTLTAITPEIETRQIRRAREREAAKRSSKEIMR